MDFSNNNQNQEEKDVDNFTPVFKFYKQRKTAPSLDNVLGYPTYELEKENVEKFEFVPSKKLHHSLGVCTTHPWNVVHVKSVPGLYVIDNLFTPDGIKQWSKRCLESYCKKPNKTNLDSSFSEEEIDSIWKRSYDSFDEHARKPRSKDISTLKSSPVWKLRWSTLGYHHNWDTKVYNTDAKFVIPSELGELCTVLAEAINWSPFKSEAAIVNYYHEGSTLCAHVDNSEHNQVPPVISLSFGLPAIFLIGGTTKATRPTAVYLPSGCAVLMSGPSRLAYHAVPRVMPAVEEPPAPVHCDAIDMFLRHTRININVRQVF